MKAKWAIQPQAMFTMLNIYENRGNVDKEILEQFKAEDNNRERYAEISVDQYGNVVETTITDVPTANQHLGEEAEFDMTGQGVAILSLHGPMFKRANMLDRMSGAQSTEMIRNRLKSLDQNPNIIGVVLDIDSPGGTVDGTEELAETIKAFSKPIVAWVDGLAASAAYWVASQADEIMISSKLAEVGSIGVLLTHVDQSGWLESNGLKVTHITSTRAKDKVIAPSTEPLDPEDEKVIIEMLDSIHKMFISSIRSGRRDKLLNDPSEDVFTGKTYLYKEAQKQGLADSRGDLDSAIKRVVKLSNSQNQNQNQNSSAMDNITFDKKETPLLYSLFGKEAIAEPKNITITAEQVKEIEAEFKKLQETAENSNGKEELSTLRGEKVQLEAGLLKADTALEDSSKLVTQLTLSLETSNESLGKADTEIIELKKANEKLSEASAGTADTGAGGEGGAIKTTDEPLTPEGKAKSAIKTSGEMIRNRKETTKE